MKIEVHRHPGTPRNVDTVEAEVMELGDDDRPTMVEVHPEAASRVVLREVFNAVTLITADGETLVVNMRDSGFECAYQSGDTIVPFELQRGVATIRQVDPLQADGGVEPQEGPHSRACGFRNHEHGTACSTNCPTCHGQPL